MREDRIQGEPRTTPVVMDAHSHLYPRPYIDLLKERSTVPRMVGDPPNERFLIFESEDRAGGTRGRFVGEEFWDVEAKLAFMDSAGIDRSIVSLGNPWLDPFSEEVARQAADVVNAELAALNERTGGRIVGLGSIPQHDVVAAATGVRGIAGTPELYGVANGTRLCGLMFDDERLEPVWEALEDTALPFVVHPHYSLQGPEVSGYGIAMSVALGFPFETSAAISRLILGGVTNRHPGLRVVAAHGGGTLPFLWARLDTVWRTDPQARELCPRPPSEYLSRMALDALVYAEGPVRLVVDTVGVDNAMFGTDHPFSVADPAPNLKAIEAAVGAERSAAILSDSAMRWFGVPAVSDSKQAWQ